MSLSCSCDYDYEYDAGEWYYAEYTADFTLLDTHRRKRCCSCGELIDIGSLCIKFPRSRYPHNDVESRIMTGRCLEDSLCDEAPINIAAHYQCERCAEIFLNLTDIGYECLSPSEDMRESLKEYHELSGFNPSPKKKKKKKKNNRRG